MDLSNLRPVSLASRVSNHHGYLSNYVLTIFIPVNIVSIVQQRWLIQMKIRYTPITLMRTRHIYRLSITRSCSRTGPKPVSDGSVLDFWLRIERSRKRQSSCRPRKLAADKTIARYRVARNDLPRSERKLPFVSRNSEALNALQRLPLI